MLLQWGVWNKEQTWLPQVRFTRFSCFASSEVKLSASDLRILSDLHIPKLGLKSVSALEIKKIVLAAHSFSWARNSEVLLLLEERVIDLGNTRAGIQSILKRKRKTYYLGNNQEKNSNKPECWILLQNWLQLPTKTTSNFNVIYSFWIIFCGKRGVCLTIQRWPTDASLEVSSTFSNKISQINFKNC